MGKYQNEDLIEVFEDTRRWCRSEKALREAVEHSLAETKLYSVGEELHYDKSRYAEPVSYTHLLADGRLTRLTDTLSNRTYTPRICKTLFSTEQKPRETELLEFYDFGTTFKED